MEKKSRYNEAWNKQTQAYHKANLEIVSFRVRKGTREIYKNAAEADGLSLAKFIEIAIAEKIARDLPGFAVENPVTGADADAEDD